MKNQIIEESPVSQFLFSSTKMSWLWLIVRLYVGMQWLEAGWQKLQSASWVGGAAGKALGGFVQGALGKTQGAHPDVQMWYAYFLQHVVLPYPLAWSYAVAIGEFAVGLGLILGAFTGIAAFFGMFMNLNYLLAGTVSVNPTLFALSVGLILAWKVAGYWGADQFLLPMLGTPWKPGNLFNR